MRVQSSAGNHAVATARRLPEQVDCAESIARVQKSRKLEERRILHINTVTRFDRRLLDTPIVTGGVEIRRLACLFLSRSNWWRWKRGGFSHVAHGEVNPYEYM